MIVFQEVWDRVVNKNFHVSLLGIPVILIETGIIMKRISKLRQSEPALKVTAMSGTSSIIFKSISIAVLVCRSIPSTGKDQLTA